MVKGEDRATKAPTRQHVRGRTVAAITRAAALHTCHGAAAGRKRQARDGVVCKACMHLVDLSGPITSAAPAGAVRSKLAGNKPGWDPGLP